MLDRVRERFAADREEIAYAAYRVGLIDALFHDDVQTALPMPGIIRANLNGERAFRLGVLAEAGVDASAWNAEIAENARAGGQ